MQQDQPEPMLSIREVRAMVSLSTATIYRMIADQRFPRRVRVSMNRVAWRRSQIAAWQQALEGFDGCNAEGSGSLAPL